MAEILPQPVLPQHKEQTSLLPEAVERIAHDLVETCTDVKPGQKVLIWRDIGERLDPLAQRVMELCNEKGAVVEFFSHDSQKEAEAVKRANNEEEMRKFFQEEAEKTEKADVIILLRCNEDPDALREASSENRKSYQSIRSTLSERRRKGDVIWTVIEWPSENEAREEGMAYDEYLELYLEACNQPWDEIKKAQEHLINILNSKQRIEFVVDNPDPKKRTKISMSIKGKTWANSTIKRNYPGSEVFTGPVKESVNGRIYAEGEYHYNGKTMKNIALVVENGKITYAYAEEGNKDLQDILDTDEGAKFFGEVALGTNPGLTRRMFNALLNEKVGGSFHMAIGKAYTYTEYDGKPVQVDNGNKSAIHWDLTVLMHRKPDGTGGGTVIVYDDENDTEGTVIQIDGRFRDPQLAVLNRKI